MLNFADLIFFISFWGANDYFSHIVEIILQNCYKVIKEREIFYEQIESKFGGGADGPSHHIHGCAGAFGCDVWGAFG